MDSPLIPPTVQDLVRCLRSPDVDTRGNAWQHAGFLSAPAIPALAPLLDDPELEVARSAKRALFEIVRLAGRPGAEAEARAVEAGLLEAYPGILSAQGRRDVIWMCSEIGDTATVGFLAAQLSDPEVREDARCALMRVPGEKSLAALEQAHQAAAGDFRDALAEALVHRGKAVPGFESRKLKPTKPTSVGISPA